MRKWPQGFTGHLQSKGRLGKLHISYPCRLPACNIHPIFHVSQFRKAGGVEHAVEEVPSQLNEELEMVVEPEAVLGIRSGTGHNIRGMDVLIQWRGLLPLEATW